MRGTTTERGYGTPHRHERAKWQPLIDAGQGVCLAAVCLKTSRWIRPGEPWHLGHSPDRTFYIGPCHPECNTSEGGRRGNRKHPKARGPIRRWRPTRSW
jgi:hypothetical protein